MQENVLKILITEQELSDRIKQLGEDIAKDYKEQHPLLVSVLKGSFMFMADLTRAIDLMMEVDFMIVSSYAGQQSTGAVKIVKDLDISLENRDILIVEDILDSGRTLEYIKYLLLGRNPSSIKICTLLDKPSKRKSNIIADYIGFTVPDEFVVGYGLDYNENYRNLRYIGVLKPEVYSG